MKRSSHCGPVAQYDYMGGMQFANLFMLGLRAHNTLLDFGCGSLRFGRFAIMYLNAGNYYGMEPEKQLIKEGVDLNFLTELCKAKKAKILVTDSCEISCLNVKFDYIIAQSVFTHMPKKMIQKSLIEAAASMSPGGLFIANYKPGNRDWGGTEWTQQNIQYTPKTIEVMLYNAGLVSSPLQMVHTHLQNWLLIRRKG